MRSRPMGKMFDTLRQALPVPAKAAAPDPGDDMSFIEIGPKRQVVAASADVLAAPSRPVPAPAP
ncbi:MAG: hypothetical protein K2W96_22575, partial [Gemmataceae bacterium]|nr:hypothetical protein [Gemmataceae bacterium]